MSRNPYILTIASIINMLEAVKSNLSSRPVALFSNVDLCNEEKKINSMIVLCNNGY